MQRCDGFINSPRGQQARGSLIRACGSGGHSQYRKDQNAKNSGHI
jgi:hypothetical protein